MRYFLMISSCFLACVAVQATQFPYDDANSNLPQPPRVYYASPIIETYLTPYDNAEARLLTFLDQSRRYCYVASYSLTNRNIISKLIELHNRGVDVQVITDKTQAAGRNEQLAIAALTANNILVFAGKSIANGICHVKFVVIDDRYVEDGSYNYTTSANREDNILNFTDSPKRAAQFLAYWEKIKMDMQY